MEAEARAVTNHSSGFEYTEAIQSSNNSREQRKQIVKYMYS